MNLPGIVKWFTDPNNIGTVSTLALTSIIAVFAAFWKLYTHFSDKPKAFSQTATAGQSGVAINVQGTNNTIGDVNASTNIKEIVNSLIAEHRRELSQYENDAFAKNQHIKDLTEAVTALSQGQGIIGSKEQITQALVALTQGDTELAKALFAKTAERGEAEAKDTAAAYRHLGVFAFFDNTQEALKAYRRATELDPDDDDGWNQLGLLFYRTGDLSAAITAYQKVLSLSEANHDQEKQSWAYGNLGNVYQTLGELDKAVEYYHLALVLHEGLGHKEGMAQDYVNLGVVYGIRRELDKAVEYFNLAQVLHEGLGSKEGIAQDYGNLGNVYKQQGHKEQAIQAYQKSIDLFKAIGNPTMVKQVQGWLDAL